MEVSPKHAAPPIETATRIRRQVSAAVSGYEVLRAPGRGRQRRVHIALGIQNLADRQGVPHTAHPVTAGSGRGSQAAAHRDSDTADV